MASDDESRQEQLTNGKWVVERLLAKRISVGIPLGDTHRKGTILYAPLTAHNMLCTPLRAPVFMPVRYKVRWRGFDEEEDSWEPKSHIDSILISEYESQSETQPSDSLPVGPERSSSPSRPKRSHEPACSPSARSPSAKALAVEIESLD